jgi:hypothetical protein
MPEEDPGRIKQVRGDKPAPNAVNALFLQALGGKTVDRKPDQGKVNQTPDRENIPRRDKQDRKPIRDVSGRKAVDRQRVGQEVHHQRKNKGQNHQKSFGFHFFSLMVIEFSFIILNASLNTGLCISFE